MWKFGEKMTENLKEQLDRVAAKAGLIVERYRLKAQQLEQAQTKVAELEEKLTACKKELEKLRVDNEYLRVVTNISPDRKDIEKVKSLISGLVRNIDRCILDLKE